MTPVTPVEPDGRRERSRRTRARIVEAAAKLFVERGYLATTIEAVAEQAGVAVQTVYYVFGTKRHVLEAALEATIAGDLEPTPVLDRPWFEGLEAAEDAAAAIALLVDASVAIIARAASIHDVVQCASADAEVAALLVDSRRRRRADQRRLAEMLAEAGHLRADLDVATAADVLYGLVNEEVFLLFTSDCGWDVERFQRWATALLQQQLT